MPRTQPRRGRFSPAAAAALLISLAVLVSALWALQRGPLPAAADFGAPAPATPTGPAAPGAAVDPVPTAAPPGEGGAEPPAGRAAPRVAVPRPAVRDASVEAVGEERQPAPTRLLAPSLGLDVPLDAVGVTGDGLMQIPEDADRAGWYRHGPAPGEAGSAVVAGHVDDLAGPGAFMALNDAEQGTPVTIVREDGSRLDYVVTARRTTDKKELPVDDLFDREGEPRLQLVTCTGEWSERAGSYTDNLVITATPVP